MSITKNSNEMDEVIETIWDGLFSESLGMSIHWATEIDRLFLLF